MVRKATRRRGSPRGALISAARPPCAAVVTHGAAPGPGWLASAARPRFLLRGTCGRLGVPAHRLGSARCVPRAELPPLPSPAGRGSRLRCQPLRVAGGGGSPGGSGLCRAAACRGFVPARADPAPRRGEGVLLGPPCWGAPVGARRAGTRAEGWLLPKERLLSSVSLRRVLACVFPPSRSRSWLKRNRRCFLRRKIATSAF